MCVIIINMKQKLVTILLAIVALLGGSYGVTQLGSIQDGQAYNATTTLSGFIPGVPTGGMKLIKTGGGTLGSVVITKSAAGSLELYDATTTVNGAVYGTTTLASFDATALAGTYTFDVAFSTGLLVVVPAGNLSTTTITYR